eukprot:TRINITY_DN22550_c0_g1_i1.p1 TRINITY_DN22550_c0_g1~~TRINITY_DN22550_c0_g1_i1.p1  ORF type:complete len:764 (-),score=122.76 TRINITY_DN22550_c0_g1_i1:136-2427(-)
MPSESRQESPAGSPRTPDKSNERKRLMGVWKPPGLAPPSSFRGLLPLHNSLNFTPKPRTPRTSASPRSPGTIHSIEDGIPRTPRDVVTPMTNGAGGGDLIASEKAQSRSNNKVPTPRSGVKGENCANGLNEASGEAAFQAWSADMQRRYQSWNQSKLQPDEKGPHGDEPPFLRVRAPTLSDVTSTDSGTRSILGDKALEKSQKLLRHLASLGLGPAGVEHSSAAADKAGDTGGILDIRPSERQVVQEAAATASAAAAAAAGSHEAVQLINAMGELWDRLAEVQSGGSSPSRETSDISPNSLAATPLSRQPEDLLCELRTPQQPAAEPARQTTTPRTPVQVGQPAPHRTFVSEVTRFRTAPSSVGGPVQAFRQPSHGGVPVSKMASSPVLSPRIPTPIVARATASSRMYVSGATLPSTGSLVVSPSAASSGSNAMASQQQLLTTASAVSMPRNAQASNAGLAASSSLLPTTQTTVAEQMAKQVIWRPPSEREKITTVTPPVAETHIPGVDAAERPRTSPPMPIPSVQSMGILPPERSTVPAFAIRGGGSLNLPIRSSGGSMQLPQAATYTAKISQGSGVTRSSSWGATWRTSPAVLTPQPQRSSRQSLSSSRRGEQIAEATALRVAQREQEAAGEVLVRGVDAARGLDTTTTHLVTPRVPREGGPLLAPSPMTPLSGMQLSATPLPGASPLPSAYVKPPLDAAAAASGRSHASLPQRVVPPISAAAAPSPAASATPRESFANGHRYVWEPKLVTSVVHVLKRVG